MVNPKARILWRLSEGDTKRLLYKQGAWYYSTNKIKYCGDTPFKTMSLFTKFPVELPAL